ncbi:MAG: hypothetical protein KW804_01420 [Candidatus Doudnabacteria bacterium]|nr:hypothetical protein [Candidatus Doudnabacteria bacterium]
MPREAIEIPQSEIEGFIRNSAQERGVELDAERDQVIADIVASAPERMYPRTLTEWCNDKVSEILSDHPNLAADADQIRSDVKKELHYLLNKEGFEDLSRTIRESKKEKFSPKDITDLNRPLTQKIERNFSNNRKVDWEWLMKKMGLEDRFERERETQETVESMIGKLVRLLETEKPDKFGPGWIQQKDDAIRKAIERSLGTKFGVPWQLIVDMLPEKWKEKWENRPNQLLRKLSSIDERLKEANARKDFNRVVNEVVSKIILDNPEKVTPSYIFNNCGAQYTFFKKFVYDSSGKIDWDLISETFPVDIRKKWDRPKPRYEDYEPKRHYNDVDEVENALNPYRDKLYTLVEFHDKGDRKSKDEIILTLVNLSKKGNDLAKERLIEYLQFTISAWIETGRLPAVLNLHQAEVLDRTERSIYLYREKNAFLVYLQVNLKLMAKGLKGGEYEFTDRDGIGLRKDARQNGKSLVKNDAEEIFRDEPTDDY